MRGDLIGNGDEIGLKPWASEKRKEERCNWMNETIVANHNSTLNYDDVLYHLGDFCFKGPDNAFKWEQRLNGKIVHIRGNHDLNNGVKTFIDKAVMEFANLNVLAQHNPPQCALEIPDFIDLVICGHIHNCWKYKILEDVPNVPIINVGLDVHGFKPISTDSLLKLYNKIKLRNEKYGVFK